MNNDTSTIGKDYSLGQLMKFVAAPVLTRIFVSFLSTLDDALFISRYCGQDALAAFSIVLPWFMLMDAIGMACAAVGTICSIKMGEKKNLEAKSDFTTMCLVAFGIGLFFTNRRTRFCRPLPSHSAMIPFCECKDTTFF